MRQHESILRPKAPRGVAGPVAGGFALVALAGAMVSGNGRYTPLAIFLVLAGFGSLIVLAREALRASRASAETWEPVLAVSLLLCLILGLTTPPGSFVQGAAYRVVQAVVNLVLIGTVARTFLRRVPVFSSCRVVFFAAVAAGFGLRLAMPVVSPSPVIDVFAQFQESAQHLLAGLNPYTVPFSDVYRGTRDYGYHTFGYAYLPANILPQTLSYWLTGDIRYGCIAAEAVVAAALYRVA